SPARSIRPAPTECLNVSPEVLPHRLVLADRLRQICPVWLVGQSCADSRMLRAGDRSCRWGLGRALRRSRDFLRYVAAPPLRPPLSFWSRPAEPAFSIQQRRTPPGTRQMIAANLRLWAPPASSRWNVAWSCQSDYRPTGFGPYRV